MLMWGRYNIANHLGAVFLASRIDVARGGKMTFRLNTPILSCIQVLLDGRPIFDTESHLAAPHGQTLEYSFSAQVSKGSHILSACALKLGRVTQMGFRLTCDREITAQLALASGMTRARRDQVERDVRALQLDRDLFYPDQDVAVRLGRSLESDTRLVCQLIRGGQTFKTIRRQPKGAGRIKIGRASEFGDGAYQLVCVFEDPTGNAITTRSFELQIRTPTAPLPGDGRKPRRKKELLKFFAARRGGIPDGIWPQDEVWPAVAQYALGQEVDEGIVADACEHISKRLDCADFVIQGIIRLLYWDRVAKRLSDEIRALMKETVLGFRYWVDEPGGALMYMGSENHRLLCHTAELLAGQLYPVEMFTNSQQRGLFHITKARMFLMEWFRQRGRFGFDEWHANSYYPVSMCGLVNLYDFVVDHDYAFRTLAANVLTTMCFNLAADSFHGVFGTTHGRSYTRVIVTPDTEGTASVLWYLYGEGSLHGDQGIGSIPLATSRYEPPALLTRIARDRKTVVESRQQQGSLIRASTTAHFVTYRTPDYTLSGLQDHRKGEFETATHVAQATFEDKTIVFLSAPQTSGDGAGLRPDYWSGHTAMPRVIQYRNVQSYNWRLGEFGWMTHCFLEQERFDKVVFDGNWVFAQKANGYIGIWSQHGMDVGEQGQYAGRELICEAPQNTWIIECGRKADWGDFRTFVCSLTSAAIDAQKECVTYESPSIGTFVTGWDVTPTVGAEPVPLRGYPLVDTPFSQSEYGSGNVTYTYGDETLDLQFDY